MFDRRRRKTDLVARRCSYQSKTMEKKNTGDDQMHDLLGSTTGSRKRNKDDDQMRDLGPKFHGEGSLFHTREHTINLNYKQRKKKKPHSFLQHIIANHFLQQGAHEIPRHNY
jgi:hypothetical protein